jgi:glycerol-3-phosphate dehydrogenase
VGLTLYDFLAGRGNLARSRPLGADEVRRRAPGLRPQGLAGGAAYADAQMDDARLCLEVVLTSAARGAVVANYVEAVGFEHAGGRTVGVRARDRLRGAEFLIRARQVLNATGPWVERVARLAGDDAGPRLRPTKGVHVVAPGRDLRAALLLLHPADGRVFFVIPWMGRTLIGTTDTFTDEPPDGLTVTDEDVRYLLEGYNHFVTPPLGPGDLCGRFVGLRPLVDRRSGAPSAVSREFQITESPGGLLSVAGGKYTTYRHMAEAITDRVVRRLGLRRRCRTRDCPLIGAPESSWERFAPAEAARLADRYGLTEGAARHLVDRYGRRADEVAALTRGRPEWKEPVVAGEPDLWAEIAFQHDHELAATPADHLLRRTRLGLFHPELLRQADVLRRAAGGTMEQVGELRGVRDCP